MRSLKKNKQKMYYALYDESLPIYEKDSQGNIIYTKGGIPVETGRTKAGYKAPVEFHACIRGKGGVASNEAYGVDADYDAAIYEVKGSLPVTETSLIWYETAPVILLDGTPDPKSADYRVKRVPPSLDEVVYLLERNIK